MAEDNDGIADALDGQLRIALTVAAQLGARFARIGEELARRRQAQTEQQNRELYARFDAERAAARAELAPVYESSWWDSASLGQIANVHETATAWRGIDPEADRARERIAQEVRERYGLDVHNLDTDRADVRDAIIQADHARADAAAERGESAADVAEAAMFLTAAETMDRTADEHAREANEQDQRILNGDAGDVGQAHADVVDNRDEARDLTAQADVGRGNVSDAFDSAQRRAQLAASLEGKVDQSVIDARLTAVADQARHPRGAVTTAPKRATKARRASAGQGQQRDRHLGR